MQIRHATAPDLDLVAPLFDGYRQFYHNPADPVTARQFMADRLRLQDSVIFLAERDGIGLGFVQLYPVFSSAGARPGRLWLLNDLFVAPAGRRLGVGRALMERATVHARETGATGLFLQTARDNHEAQALYTALGYHRDDLYLVYELHL